MSKAVVLADDVSERVMRAARALGAPVLPLAGWPARLRGADLVLGFAAPASWSRLVVRAVSLRARALLVVPLGEPVAPPWGTGAINRLVLPSQFAARAWAAWIPMGRLTVVAPGPSAGDEHDGVYVAGLADRFDPERVVAAARGGAAIVSTVADEAFPPGTVVVADAAAARQALVDDPRRRARLGAAAAAWAARGRTGEDEAAAWRCLAADARSTTARGGRRTAL
ncbi:MAG: hypothetical protein EXR71_17570 [Myxococcales bacterium]|nr:hypothetical protein [Myxococcales bacterium]